MKNKRFLSGLIALGLLVSTLAGNPATLSVVAGKYNPCEKQGNLTQNCGFDTFVDDWVGEKRYLIPTGWWYFVLSGGPEFRQADDTVYGAPSLWLVSDGVPFTAGIYQQVPVTPGVVYQSDIGWAAARCNNAICPGDMERKVGLDPTGKTNPLAPSVVWSRIEAGGDKWPDLTVSARATGPTMTVFVWVHHPTSHGVDEIFLDAVGLWPDPSQPAATVTPVVSATPTRRPPTQTPKLSRTQAARPTNTPTAMPSPTPTETWTPTPTPTPTQTATQQPPTPTSTWTLTPTPDIPTATPFPTRTPLPTIVPVARLVPSSEERLTVEEEAGNGGNGPSGAVFLYIAAGALVASIVLAIVVGWLWLRSRRSLDGR